FTVKCINSNPLLGQGLTHKIRLRPVIEQALCVQPLDHAAAVFPLARSFLISTQVDGLVDFSWGLHLQGLMWSLIVVFLPELLRPALPFTKRSRRAAMAGPSFQGLMKTFHFPLRLRMAYARVTEHHSLLEQPHCYPSQPMHISGAEPGRAMVH